MNLGIQINQGTRLEQSLSPQMIQSVNILQMNTLDLELAVKEELEQNPLLELAEDNSLTAEREEHNIDDTFEDKNEESKTGDDLDIDWEDYFSEGFGDGDRPLKNTNTHDFEEDAWKNQTADTESIQDFLKNQLKNWKRPEYIVELVEYLIDSLDEKGFVQSSPGSIGIVSETSNNPYVLEIEEILQEKKLLEEASFAVREAFHILQSLNPRGIGARNLRESLLIQAYAQPHFSDLAILILESQFENLKALRYNAIAKELDVSLAQVQLAIQEFSKLTPHPGFLISNTPVPTIVPDMMVIETETGDFKIEVRELSFRSRLRINQTYKKLLTSNKTSEKDKEYIKEKLNSANAFLKNIDNRLSTMEIVMQAIIKHQKDFFLKGPEHLHPMVLQTIADDIGRDPSTVNRVTNGKYVETPYGVYELKQFFTSSVRQEDGTDLSSARVLQAIKNLIENEDKKKPFSDQKITDLLEQMDIQVARRTVAKYREDLKILPARLRKEL
ncbi:MAG: RNA polymerase factor sigma-54 [Fibrobacter sp.]|jgi:RNA polymerase sigma-54 factor|nr:RNA polymerase factor sigma-54 [Fibrobacter sp.]